MSEVRATGLGRRYGTIRAVHDVSFTAGPGSVTGLLGPNGSGKSTVMALMVGLLRGSGRCTFDGRVFSELRYPRHEVGVLIGTAPWNTSRTGAGHLRLVAAGSGVGRSRVGQVADLVGITDVIGRRIRGYSLGMRQRLSIATALLGDPGVLVLDEPTNGLDAGGMRWLRDLLTGFTAEGRTVILSSHLLDEVAQLATDVVMMNQGRVRAVGPLTDLTATSQTTRVETTDPDAVEALLIALRRAGLEVVRRPGWLEVATRERELIGRLALAANIALTRLEPAGNLADYYQQVTE